MHETTPKRAQCTNCGDVIFYRNVKKEKKCKCGDMQIVRLAKDEVSISSSITVDKIKMTDYVYE